MTEIEFINKVVGLPWVDRACSFSAVDCWGLVVLYFEHVHRIKITEVDGYKDKATDITNGFLQQLNSGVWQKVDKPEGLCITFVIFRDKEPRHVGVVVNGGEQILHAYGTQARIDGLKAFQRIYNDIQFYRYQQ